MKILAVACQKGGVGKSTLAINLAAAFSLMESHQNEENPEKILLIDMDKQHHSSKTLAGGVFGSSSGEDENEFATLSQCLTGRTPLPISAVAKKSHLPESKKLTELYYVPSEFQGMEEAEHFLNSDTTGQFRLSDLLQPLDSIYKYIVIDTPPDLSIMTDNALVAATHVLVPIDLQAFSMDALLQTIAKIDEIRGHPRFNPELQLAGIVLTKCNLRHSEEREWYELLKRDYPDDILSPIAFRGDVHTAQSQGKDIFSYKPPRDPEAIESSNLATQEYGKVANEVKKRIDRD
jgi:chromosome partitioning protein